METRHPINYDIKLQTALFRGTTKKVLVLASLFRVLVGGKLGKEIR